jgi:hypothetical protein
MHFYGYDTQKNPAKLSCPGANNGDFAELYLSHRGQYINNRPADKREPDGKGDFENIYGDWFAYHFGDKDSYYYRGAFLDCVQGVRFMATRPTSDMENLFAEGSSQGGALCYAAAALSDIPFTAIAPNVAFLGDFPDYFRIVSWPGDTARANQGSMTDEERERWYAAYARNNASFFANQDKMTEEDILKWKYQRYIKDYVRVIKSVDDSVGEILDYLEANGLMDNTMIVYTSDQGFYMGEHGWFDKRFMYEESFRTPLIVYYPGGKGGKTSQTLVQNLDFGPTFLDIAGAPQPENMYGVSMLPVLKKDGATPRKWRETLYYHFYDHTPEHNVLRHDGIFDSHYKLIHFYDETGAIPSYEEFFDLQADPNELNNVIDDPRYKKLVDKFSRQLTETRAKIGVTEY